MGYSIYNRELTDKGVRYTWEESILPSRVSPFLL
jgi:hypothetical protein